MKPTTDGTKSLDVGWLKRNRMLIPGTISTQSWKRNGKPDGSIEAYAKDDCLVLVYNWRGDGAEWEEVRETIGLTWSDCNYGGSRPWFVCPGCARRVGKLFGVGKLFLCRHCYNIAYSSQNETSYDRLLRKVQGIRERLGGSGNLSMPFPPKPKGMHYETYYRIRFRCNSMELSMYGQIAQVFGFSMPNKT
jgi:hypothetical protein